MTVDYRHMEEFDIYYTRWLMEHFEDYDPTLYVVGEVLKTEAVLVMALIALACL